MNKILVIDQGTTSTRAILYGPEGSLISSHQIEFQQYFPHLGWVEHDPEEIWRSVKKCCDFILQDLPENELIGMGITNQRETTVVWDRDTGKPIYRAIVWQDRRTSDYCTSLKNEQLESLIYQKTGLLLDPYFSATKLQWILTNIAGVLERAKKGELLFGTIDSFLLWRLTNGKVHATDITNASRTLLFNIKEQCWDESLLEMFAIPAQMLPKVMDNTGQFGITDKKIFGREIPILAMMGDQQAAMIGQGCFEIDAAKCTYGTGSFLMVNTGKDILPSKNKLLNTIAYRIDGQLNFAQEGSIFAAGAIIKWFHDKLKVITSADETEPLIKNLESNGGIYFVPAFTGLGAPYWDATAKGAIYGLTRDTDIAHLIRAGLEAIAYQTKDLLLDAPFTLPFLKVDGGVSKNQWLMQFLADILQIPVVVSAISEATSLGVAYLVALASKQLENLNQIHSLAKPGKTYYPSMKSDQMNKLYAEWRDAVNATLCRSHGRAGTP